MADTTSSLLYGFEKIVSAVIFVYYIKTWVSYVRYKYDRSVFVLRFAPEIGTHVKSTFCHLQG